MKVLVTGAYGFIGRAVCLELEKDGFEVIRQTRRIPAYVKDTGQENIFLADITDRDSLDHIREAGEIHALVHTAGLAHQFADTSEESFWKVNVEGTKNIAELALKLSVKHFIQISSVSVYGSAKSTNTEAGIVETAVCDATDPYGQSKLEAEKACQVLLAGREMSLTILRLATVVGEEDPGNVRRLIRAVDQRRFFWIGSGENRKSLIYRGDVARAIKHILKCPNRLEKRTEGNTYNLSAKPLKMKQIVEIISKHLNKKVLPFRIPFAPLKILLDQTYSRTGLERIGRYQKILNKWLGDECYAGGKFEKMFDFKVSFEPELALSKEIDWYLDSLKK